MTNVDFSGTLIHDLRKQCDSLYHGLNFIELDCRNMNQLPDESFDLVIEKGLIDSVLCNSDPQRSIAQVLGEACRVLKTSGSLVSISCADVHCRLASYKNAGYPWRVSTYTVRSSGILYPVFVCTKTQT